MKAWNLFIICFRIHRYRIANLLIQNQQSVPSCIFDIFESPLIYLRRIHVKLIQR